MGCCARTPSGHAAAAPPSSVMNSRRLMSDIRLPPTRMGCRRSVYRKLSLPRGGWKVLGADLNCSESRRCPAPHCASNQTSIAHGERLYGHVETVAQIGPLVSSHTASKSLSTSYCTG